MVRGVLFRMEVVLALAAGWLVVSWVPFRRLVRLLGGIGSVTGRPEHSPSGDARRARVIARAIHRVAGRLPWHSTCFMKAVAGRLMLHRRGIPSAIRLGVAVEGGRLRAHAWLLGGGLTLLGGRSHDDYSAIAEIR